MQRIVPVATTILGIAVLAFLGGVFSAHYQMFPYPHIRDALRTMRVLIKVMREEDNYLGEYLETASQPASSAAEARWTLLDPTAERFPLLVNGGLNQFLEHCPEQGCLAVSYDAQGNLSGSWPYQPEAIYAKDLTAGAYPHEMLTFEPRQHVYPVSVQPYGDGDLLVNFQARGGVIFPFAMGVSRVASDGLPRWTRFDFSHHWSTLRADGVALVPGLQVADSSLSFTQGTAPSAREHLLTCHTDRPQLDTLQFIDAQGSLLQEIPLTAIITASNWVGILPETSNPCDPIHLNYIDTIGPDAGADLAAGDLVLSLRNLSRLMIFDPQTQQIKRVVAGGFIQQHSVHHLRDSVFLIFDNRGGDALGPASRIISLDLASGVERRIFPNPDTPAEYAQVFTDTAGYLDISPDGRRVLASFTHAGKAFEVDIDSGRLIAVYDNLHDISALPAAPQEAHQQAARYAIYGISYLR